MEDLPKRIKKILQLLLRGLTPARKCQMQRFPKSTSFPWWPSRMGSSGEAAARPAAALGVRAAVLRCEANFQTPHSVSLGSS